MAVYTDIRTVLGGLQGEAPVYNSSLKELLILVFTGKGVGEDVIIPYGFTAANSIQSENKSNWPDAKEILQGVVIGFDGVEGADTTTLSELLAGQNTSGDIYCDQLKPIFYEIANIFEAVIG